MKGLQGKKSVVGFFAGTLVLILLGSYQAQAAWTKSETSRVKKLENRIAALEQQIQDELASQEVVTIRYLASEPSSGTYFDVCPGIENLDGGQRDSYIGRLTPVTDLFGRPRTDISGRELTQPVYRCKIQFVVKRSR